MSDNARVQAIYVELQANIAQYKAAMGEATAATRQFTQNTRAQMEEARGSIALLGEEIGVRLPRHLRSFVAELPGVAKAMSAAFEAVAVIALISVVVEAGKKIYEFAQKNEEAAKKNAEAWKGVAEPIRSINAELTISNSRIQDSIAKLEHKPAEGMKTALLEAADAASKLGDKLDADINKMLELTKQDKAGLLDRLSDGGQDDIDRTIAFGANQFKKINPEYQDVLNRSAASGDRSNYNKVRQEQIAALHAAIDPQIATLAEYLRQNQDSAGSGNKDYDKARGGYDALTGILSATQDQATLEQSQQKQKGLQDSKSNDAELLNQLQKTLETREALHGKSVGEEATYWEKYLSTFKVGSDQWLAVQKAFLSTQDALQKNFTEPSKLKKGITAFNTEQDTGAPQSKGQSEAITLATARAAVEQAKLTGEWTLAADKLGLLTGSVTAHQAALDAAAAHTAEYKAQLAALKTELAQLQAANPFEVDEKQIGVSTQIDTLNAKAKIQAMEDAQATLSTTWTGMIDNVWDTLVKRAQDTQQELAHIALSTIDSLNSELAKGITGGKMDLSKTFMSSAQGLAKTGLQTAEGGLLKTFGLGGKKRDGSSASDALFVQMAGLSGLDTSMFKGATPHVSGPAGGLISKAGGGLLGLLNNSNWASKLFGGKLFGSGSIFGGHFATGGNVQGGVPIEVGELGREMFVPPSNGRIVPNKDISSGGPSIGYIDARATDPVLTHMAVVRGMQIAHGQAVRDAQKQIIDRQRRSAH